MYNWSPWTLFRRRRMERALVRRPSYRKILTELGGHHNMIHGGGGGGGTLGGKYDNLLRKNANIRGKRWKKSGKRVNFYCTWGKKYDFWEKKGGEAKISIILTIYTPVYFHNISYFVQNVAPCTSNFVTLFFKASTTIWLFQKVEKGKPQKKMFF